MHYKTLLSIPGTVEPNNLYRAIDDALLPFDENAENPEYTKFYQDEHIEEYENNTVKAVLFPDRTYTTIYDYKFSNRFRIDKNSNIIPINDNSLNRELARRLIICEAPIKKVYRSYDEFMKRYYGYIKQNGQWGYMSNPLGAYDWYQIGGRYSGEFISKICINDDISIGKASIDNSEYYFVDISRKKDIPFDILKQLRISQTKQIFEECRKRYNSYKNGNGMIGDGFSYDAENKVLRQYGSIIYYEDEKFETFISRLYPHLLHESAFALPYYGFFIHQPGFMQYYNRWDMNKDNIFDEVSKYIASLDDDAWLINLDIHQ